MRSKETSRDDWTRVRFGDVVRLVRDRVNPEGSGIRRYVAGEHMDTDDLRIRRWGNVGDCDLGPAFHMRFRPGHVLYGSRRTYLRKVALADFEGICANTTFVLESADPATLFPELLPFIMQSEAFHEHSIKQSKGSVNPYVNFSDLAWYEFALPPLNQQSQLAATFSAAASLKSDVLSVRQACATLQSSLADSLVHTYGNNMRPLGAALTPNVRRHRLQSSEAYRWAGVLSFGKGILDRGEVSGSKSKYQFVHSLRTGDVVFSKLKAWEGATAVVPDGFDGAVVSPEFPTFGVDANVALPSYLSLVFKAPWFWQTVRNASKGTVERRTRIYPHQFMQLMIPLPTIHEQTRVVERVQVLSAAETASRQREQSMRSLLNGLLTRGSATRQLQL